MNSKILIFSATYNEAEYIKIFLDKIFSNKIDLDVLKANKLISRITKEVKVINSGELKKAIKIKGLKISKTASEEVKKSGGEVG